MNAEPREGKWQKRPGKRRVDAFLVYMFAYTPFQVLGVYGILNRIWWAATVGTTMVWLALVLGVGCFLIKEWRIRRRQSVDEALTERPAGLVEYPVEVSISVGYEFLGLDRGVVYFEEDRFGFVGSSFSFLLAAQDFVNTKEGPLMQRDLMFRRLLLRVPGDKAELRVKPLIGHGKAYRVSLQQFFDEAKVLEGERQWPPLSKYVDPPPESALPAQTEEELTPLKVSL